jgi:hypothetical protein
MLDRKTDGRLQVTAALSLLERSGLVEWNPEQGTFEPVERDAFEFYWRRGIDPVFGRLMCWINFSAGAEFLAKGICLVNDIELRDECPVPTYPTTEIDSWASQFKSNWKQAGTVPVTNFGTLEKLTHGKNAPLARLYEVVTPKPSSEDTNRMYAAYELLHKSIRNRDVHAYVPRVRDSHHHLVPELFSGCFNLLVSWIPDGGATRLNRWLAEAKAFTLAV